MKGMLGFTAIIIAVYVAIFHVCQCIASSPTCHICDSQELAPEPAVFDSPEPATSPPLGSAEHPGSPLATLEGSFDVTRYGAVADGKTDSSLVCYLQILNFFQEAGVLEFRVHSENREILKVGNILENRKTITYYT